MLNKAMKKSALALAISGLLAGSAFAMQPGTYAGIQLGWGTIHQGGVSNSSINNVFRALGPNFVVTSRSNSNSDSGFAGRIFGGYQFCQYWAAELGFSKFTNATAKANAAASYPPGPLTANLAASGSVSAYAVDLVAKGILPIQDNFSAYGKLGAAYLNENGHINLTASNSAGTIVGGRASAGQSRVLPTASIGLAYDVNRCTAVDLGWNHIQTVGSNHLGNTDMVALGVSYSFG
ncbi:hypothetical protein AYO45_02570 [Gammaproteobacteria bacterium SCGC AG-212-F23]|nr:hypothetical protein AYO45_02570 [Gammaproteobacteria bacterium SCGC AG-212-F23]